jgi:hypothetical protein
MRRTRRVLDSGASHPAFSELRIVREIGAGFMLEPILSFRLDILKPLNCHRLKVDGCNARAVPWTPDWGSGIVNLQLVMRGGLASTPQNEGGWLP